MPSNGSGQPLDAGTLAALRRVVSADGEATTWQRLRISPSTEARALAGLGLQRGTQELIHRGLVGDAEAVTAEAAA